MRFVSFIPWLRNIIQRDFFITDQKGCTWSLTWYSKLKEDLRLMVPMTLILSIFPATYFLYVRVREWTCAEMKPFLLLCFPCHPAFTQRFFSLVRVFKSSSKQIEKREKNIDKKMLLLVSPGSGSVSSSQNKGFESHCNLNLAWPTETPKKTPVALPTGQNTQLCVVTWQCTVNKTFANNK